MPRDNRTVDELLSEARGLSERQDMVSEANVDFMQESMSNLFRLWTDAVIEATFTFLKKIGQIANVKHVKSFTGKFEFDCVKAGGTASVIFWKFEKDMKSFVIEVERKNKKQKVRVPYEWKQSAKEFGEKHVAASILLEL